MRGRVALLLLLAGALLLGATPAVLAEGRRVALVVGNSAYRSVPELANPANDARLVARTLAGLGFTLVGGGAQTNLDKPGFAAAVRAFGQALPGAEMALFYYAGHGMQVAGENWLVPVDANPARVQDLDFQMVDASLVLKQRAGTKLNVIILDACRNNPFGGRGLRGSEPGLAQMQAPEGTVISYATQPGNVAMDGSGADSPFSLALVEAMRLPGLDVLRMFNRVGVAVKRGTGGVQQPWVSNSPIEGDYYFAGAGAAGAAVPPVAVQTPTQTPGAANPGRSQSGLFARVTAQAQPEGIPLLDFFDIVPPAAGVPPEMARFVGAWGPARWNGGPNHFMFVVEHVDAAGNARVVYLQSFACYDRDCTVALRKPAVQYRDGKIAGGVLSFTSRDDFWRTELAIGPDGQMHARTFRGLTQPWARAALSRIE